VVRGTLLVLDRHGPILAEWPADNGIVCDLNDHIPEPYVDEGDPERSLENR
jgi:hypothetical protein